MAGGVFRFLGAAGSENSEQQITYSPREAKQGKYFPCSGCHPRYRCAIALTSWDMKDGTLEPALDELLAELAERGDLRAYTKNEIVFSEGDRDASLYLLISGRLKVFTRDGRGRELVYNVMHPGEVFGELGLDGGSRSASVKAVEPSRCAVIGRKELRQFMRRHRDFAEYLVLTLIARLRHATRQVRGLALSDVYGRTVALLQAEVVKDGDGNPRLPPHLTQREIAARVGATREMIGQILRELQRSGVLVRDDRKGLLVSGTFPKRW